MPCGSSAGSGVAAAAVTETDGPILCPSAANSVVRIKPTVGLTSPITPTAGHGWVST
jgi:amidase